MSPNLAIGCIGAVAFGIGNGIGLVCNITLIQQVVSDDRRGQIFAVLGSLVQTFTLVGTLLAGPITDAVGPRTMWGISAALLIGGFLNAVVVSAVRPTKAPRPAKPEYVFEVQAGGETPASRWSASRPCSTRWIGPTSGRRQPGCDCTRDGRRRGDGRRPARGSAGRAAGDGELVLRVDDPLLELPAVARPSRRRASRARPGRLELRLRAGVVDLLAR